MAATARYLVLIEHREGLQGVDVAVGRQGRARILSTASTQVTHPEAALKAVLADLASSRRPPRRALVVSKAASVGLIHLPIPGTRGRRHGELTRLVRWEMEPFIAQQQAYSEDEPTASATTGADHACGWSPQPHVADDPEGHGWLALTVPIRVRTHWRELLRTHGQRLEAIYPQVGLAAAALSAPDDVRTLLIEGTGTRIACTRWRGGRIEAMEILPRSSPSETSSAVTEWSENQDPRTILVGSRDFLTEVGSSGNSATEALLQATIECPEGLESATIASAAAAARHASGHAPRSSTVSVAASDPAPPITSRRGVRALGFFLLLGSGLFGADRVIQHARNKAHDTWSEARTRAEDKRAHVSRAQLRQQEVERLQQRLDEARNAEQEIAQRLSKLKSLLPERRKMLPSLLASLGQSATPSVLIKRVWESEPGNVSIDGRATSDAEAQRFAQRLGRSTAALALEVHDITIAFEEHERLYRFTFQLRNTSTPAEGS